MTTNRIFAEVTFEWKHEGKQVFLCGSFDDWAERKTMKKEGGKWTVTLLLSPGTYSYKFVVDDRWCFDIEKPNFIDTFAGSANNTITIEDWRSELISERSKNRDQIQAEVNRKMTSEFELRKKQLEEETARKIQALESDWAIKQSNYENEIASLIKAKTQLEQSIQYTSAQLEESRKNLNKKQSVIEEEVRHKYDGFVNALHNESVQMKLQLEKERNLALEYKKKFELEKEKK